VATHLATEESEATCRAEKERKAQGLAPVAALNKKTFCASVFASVEWGFYSPT
jgi:hypothetical protein